MWGYIKQKLLRIGSNSKLGLINNVKEIWNSDNDLKDLCEALVASMPERVADVIKNHGGPIGYKKLYIINF